MGFMLEWFGWGMFSPERQHGWGIQAGVEWMWTWFSSQVIGLWEILDEPVLPVWAFHSLTINWEQLVKCSDVMANIDIVTLILVCKTLDSLSSSLFIILFIFSPIPVT